MGWELLLRALNSIHLLPLLALLQSAYSKVLLLLVMISAHHAFGPSIRAIQSNGKTAGTSNREW